MSETTVNVPVCSNGHNMLPGASGGCWICPACGETFGTPRAITPGEVEARREVATAAMQGILACPDAGGNEREVAEAAVRCADALLAALAGEKP